MLAAVKGIIQGNRVVIKNEDLREYDGTEVAVTLLENPKEAKQRAPINWDSYVLPSERGKDVDGYLKEMRDNDRL